MPSEPDVTLADIKLAAERIRPIVARTPLIESNVPEVWLKVESLQPTGSFKVRGAASKILKLDAVQQSRGVVAVSTGNHGRAVAYVSGTLGIPSTICVSNRVPRGKIDALESLGGDVIVEGDSQDAATEVALSVVKRTGATMVHPFDDPDVIAGQGTVGLEIASDLPDHDLDVLIPLSGGGLFSGVASALKSLRPHTRTTAVSMSGGAAMAQSIEAGTPVAVSEVPTLADSLQGGIGAPNVHTFKMVSRLADGVHLVSEREIWSAMQWVYRNHGLVLEGAGAVGIAAILSGKVAVNGPTVVVCSGGNVEMGDRIALGHEGEAPDRTGESR